MFCVYVDYNLFNRKWLPKATDFNQALVRPNSAIMPIGLQAPVVGFCFFFFISPFLAAETSEGFLVMC